MRCDPRIDVHQAEQKQGWSGLSRKSIHYPVHHRGSFTFQPFGSDQGCSMSSWDEEMFTMMSGLVAVAVFCIAALLWLV